LHWRSSPLNAKGVLLMSSPNPQSPAGRVCFCILVFAIALYLFASIRHIDRDLKQDSDWRTYFTKDAMHYYVIAEAFASGDFSMSYEKGWPYRQPLFPLLVAAVMKVTKSNLFAIRMINVSVIVVATISLFLILRAFWQRDSATAAIISILFVLNPFVYDQSVFGLNTEPLHLLLLICIVACFLCFITLRHWIYLLLLFFTIALDYLDRVNGSFLAISAFVVLISFEFSQYLFGPKRAPALAMRRTGLSGEAFTALRIHGREFAKSEASGVSADGSKSDTPSVVSWWHYLVAALILIATTAPSWLSRLHYFGNPFFYGAIQNFLWGDSYLGSLDSPRMLTARDYFASHSLLDAAGRFLLGCSKVFFAIPIDRERLPLLYFGALAGIWFAWRQKRKAYLWLLLFYGLQMLPLAWTQPVNTTPRIPYAATQPFELFLAAIFVYWLWKKTQADTPIDQRTEFSFEIQ
jgi:Dolichyl-phosphate-mannose-protein mannosyltransferase